jgi:hypothetical protein
MLVLRVSGNQKNKLRLERMLSSGTTKTDSAKTTILTNHDDRRDGGH